MTNILRQLMRLEDGEGPVAEFARLIGDLRRSTSNSTTNLVSALMVRLPMKRHVFLVLSLNWLAPRAKTIYQGRRESISTSRAAVSRLWLGWISAIRTVRQLRCLSGGHVVQPKTESGFCELSKQQRIRYSHSKKNVCLLFTITRNSATKMESRS